MPVATFSILYNAEDRIGDVYHDSNLRVDNSADTADAL